MTATTPTPAPMPTPTTTATWPWRIRFVRFAGLSLKIDLATIAISVVLVLVALVVSVWSLGVSTTGSPNLGMGQTLRVLAGQVSGAPANHVAAALPAVLIALAGGASLALSGAIFQTMTRNPLGSPDIIGFTTGAYTGALVTLLVLHKDTGAATIGALIGCLATGFAVWYLGMRGGSTGYRLVIVGVGISAMLMAFNGYLIATSNLQNAASAAA